MELLPLLIPGRLKSLEGRRHFFDVREVNVNIFLTFLIRLIIQSAFQFYNFQESADLSEAIRKPNRIYPYLLSIGNAYHVIVEKESIIQTQVSSEGLLNLFSCLYVFNIKYSPSVEPSFLFIQSEILNKKDSFTSGSKNLGIFLKLLAAQSEEDSLDSTSEDSSEE